MKLSRAGAQLIEAFEGFRPGLAVPSDNAPDFCEGACTSTRPAVSGLRQADQQEQDAGQVLLYSLLDRRQDAPADPMWCVRQTGPEGAQSQGRLLLAWMPNGEVDRQNDARLGGLHLGAHRDGLGTAASCRNGASAWAAVTERRGCPSPQRRQSRQPALESGALSRRQTCTPARTARRGSRRLGAGDSR